MYNLKKYRTILTAIFVGFIISLFLASAITWNILTKLDKLYNLHWFILFVALLLIAGCWLFFLAHNMSNETKFENYISEIKKEERAKFLNEIEQNKTSNQAEIKENINIEDILNKIIPDIKEIKSIEPFAKKVLSNLAKEIQIVQGLCYIKKNNSYTLTGEYAFTAEEKPADFKSGETIPGQAAENREVLLVEEIPENYFPAVSGTGNSVPKHLVCIPILDKNKTIALLELASFTPFKDIHVKLFNTLKNSLGERIKKLSK
jgi:putative methionine-R-sulfoxide reductase with GAF domain